MSVTAHTRRSATGGAVTVADLAARLRSVPGSPATIAAPAETSVSVGELLRREGRSSRAETRPAHQRKQRTAAERRANRSQALAAVAGAAVVYVSVLAGGLVSGYLDERDAESGEVFGPDGTRADQHKAGIPTASAQAIRPIPAATPHPSATIAAPIKAAVARSRVVIEAAPPSSGGSTMRSPEALGTWSPPPSRHAPEGDAPPPSSTTASPTPTTTSESSEDPDDSGGNERPDAGRNNVTGGGNGDSGNRGSGSVGSRSDEKPGGNSTKGGDSTEDQAPLRAVE